MGGVVSQAHDTVRVAMPVNACMERCTHMGAAVAALFAMVGLSAQEARTPVQEVIAAATLAESKGDHAGAMQMLKVAHERAQQAQNEGDVARLREALVRFAQAGGAQPGAGLEPQLAAFMASIQGRPEAQGAPAGSDPVQRLIAVLDEGTPVNSAVDAANKQLGDLGALVVPALVAALPKAGQFGVVNAMRLLEPHSDPRIAPALLERANADPAIAALVVEHLERMKRDVRLPIVQALVQRDLPAETRVKVLDAMEGLPECDAVRKSMALQMAMDGKAQGWLLSKLREWKVDWSGEVLQILRGSSDPGIAAGVTSRWLQTDLSVDEAAAVAAIEKLDASKRWMVAAEVARRRPEMARVAMLSIDEFTDWKNTGGGSWFGSGVEWWRQGGAAAVKLLQAWKAHPQIDIDNALVRIIDSGWQVPPELEDTLGQRSLQYLVMALPKDADDRALAIWRRLGSYERRGFVNKVIESGRPWHRVVAAQIATAQEWNQVQPQWIERDWSGAPPEAAAALLELARRFPDPAVGRIVVEGQGIRSTSARPGAWHGALIAACERTPELPAEIVLIFAKAGDEQAWHVLAKRDPRAALELARDPSRRCGVSLARLLGEHGTAADVPTMVRMLESFTLSPDSQRQVLPFIERHCRGNLDVANRLYQQLSGRPPSEVMLAFTTAAGVAIEQLAELIERTPQLQRDVASVATGAMQGLITAAQSPVLVQALDKALAREPISLPQVQCILQLMQACASPDCLPALRRALASPKADPFTPDVARAALAVAGPQRRAVLLELLGAPNSAAVQVALDADGLGQEQELLARATEAMLRYGKQLGSVDTLFNSLDPATRATQARAVLQSPNFPQFHQQFCISVLQALGSLKDPQFVAELAKGAQHPDLLVRMAAVEQLGRVFTRDAAPFLLELLKDDDEAVRKVAKDSLDRLAEYLDARTKWDERLNRK